jgi:hypothetical protein
VIDGQTLKLFGRRGKTYKGHLNLLAVTALKPASDATAPPGALELHVRASRTRCQTCVLAPDHSVDDLFLELGNAVPSHVTSIDLWRKHMGSRPAVTSETCPREYHVGKTLGTGTFGKVCAPPDHARTHALARAAADSTSAASRAAVAHVCCCVGGAA